MQALLERFRHKLTLHPSALAREFGAALPLPFKDPNPGLTIALHDLWLAMRPFGPPSENSSEVFFFNGVRSTPRDEPFKTFGPALVSSFF